MSGYRQIRASNTGISASQERHENRDTIKELLSLNQINVDFDDIIESIALQVKYMLSSLPSDLLVSRAISSIPFQLIGFRRLSSWSKRRISSWGREVIKSRRRWYSYVIAWHCLKLNVN